MLQLYIESATATLLIWFVIELLLYIELVLVNQNNTIGSSFSL